MSRECWSSLFEQFLSCLELQLPIVQSSLKGLGIKPRGFQTATIWSKMFFSQQTSKLVLGMTTPVRNDARAALFATLIGCRSPTRCNSWTQCSDKHLNLFFSSLSISLSVSVGERVCLYVCVLCVLLNERGRCHCVCVRVS